MTTRTFSRERLVATSIGTIVLLVLALLGNRARGGTPYGWEERLRSEAMSANRRLDRSSDVGDDVLGYFLVYAADLVALAAVLGAAALLAGARRTRFAIAIVPLFAAGVALVLGLKHVFDRSLPPYAKYELPSGHAARSLLAVGLLALVLRRTGWWRVALGAGAAHVAAVALLLLYEDWHLGSDVVAGWAVAVAILAATSAHGGFAVRDDNGRASD